MFRFKGVKRGDFVYLADIKENKIDIFLGISPIISVGVLQN